MQNANLRYDAFFNNIQISFKKLKITIKHIDRNYEYYCFSLSFDDSHARYKCGHTFFILESIFLKCIKRNVKPFLTKKIIHPKTIQNTFFFFETLPLHKISVIRD